jgi:hypothetical protein
MYVNRPYKLTPASTDTLSALQSYDAALTDQIGNSCLICQEMFEAGGQIVDLPSCQHAFHKHCILQWLKLVRYDTVLYSVPITTITNNLTMGHFLCVCVVAKLVSNLS